MKNHPISEAGVRFRNIVWSVYQDIGGLRLGEFRVSSYKVRDSS